MDDEQLASLLTGLVGLGATIGGQVPSLRKQKRPESASNAARQVTNQVSRDALSVAAQGNSANRGLQLRTALRSAERARTEGAAQAAQIGLQEDRQRQALEAQRRQRIGQVAAAAGGGAAALGAQLLAANPSAADPKGGVRPEPARAALRQPSQPIVMPTHEIVGSILPQQASEQALAASPEPTQATTGTPARLRPASELLPAGGAVGQPSAVLGTPAANVGGSMPQAPRTAEDVAALLRDNPGITTDELLMLLRTGRI